MSGGEAVSHVAGSTILRLARGVRLHNDKARQRTVLLAPERTIALDEIAVAIVESLDGKRSVDAVIAVLATAYEAPEETVGKDVTAFLGKMHRRGLVEVSP